MSGLLVSRDTGFFGEREEVFARVEAFMMCLFLLRCIDTYFFYARKEQILSFKGYPNVLKYWDT